MSTTGILGAGNIGQAVARALAKNGIRATIANSRGPESLEAMAPLIQTARYQALAR